MQMRAKSFFLSQTCSRHGMSIQSRAQHYTSTSHAHNKWETRGTGTHGHFSPSPLEVAHCVQQLLAVIAIGIGLSHRLSQAAYKKNSTFRISRAQYREGMAKMFNALSGDWPAPFGVGAFQHPPSDRYSPRISGRNSRPNSRRHRLKSASED